MKNFNIILLIAIVVGIANAQNSTICPKDLPHFVKHILSKSQYNPALWGIKIDAFNGKTFDTLFEHNADLYFSPASNNKVITTSAAFVADGIGPEFAYSTPYWSNISPNYLCIQGLKKIIFYFIILVFFKKQKTQKHKQTNIK